MTITWKFLIQIQKTGYLLHVIYVSTDDLDVLNKRIETRVKQGDHYVRPDIVKERYVNGLALLRHYFKIHEKLQLFDNSQTSVLMAEVETGSIIGRAEILPSWIYNNLKDYFDNQKDEKIDVRALRNIEEVRKLYRTGNKPSPSSGENL